MIGGSPLAQAREPEVQRRHARPLTFSGAAAGTGTLVLVNRPGRRPAAADLRAAGGVKTPAAPVTHQLNSTTTSRTSWSRAATPSRSRLQDQPSTDFQWKFQKPNAKVLKQVGKPKFFRQQRRHRRQGQDGVDVQRGRRGQDPADRRLQHAAGRTRCRSRRGRSTSPPSRASRPRPSARSTTYPADTRARAAGRRDQAQAGRQRRHVGQARPRPSSSPRRSRSSRAGTTVVTFKAEAPRRRDPGAGRRRPAAAIRPRRTRSRPPSARARLPKTVSRGRASRGQADRRCSAGETVRHRAARATPRPPAISGPSAACSPTAWSSRPATRRSTRRRRDMPGAPGMTTMPLQGRGGRYGAAESCSSRPPGDGGTPGGIYMTMVNVQ